MPESAGAALRTGNVRLRADRRGTALVATRDIPAARGPRAVEAATGAQSPSVSGGQVRTEERLGVVVYGATGPAVVVEWSDVGKLSEAGHHS
jgi:hypothetical protein